MKPALRTIFSSLVISLCFSSLSLYAQEQDHFKRLFDETIDFKSFLQFDHLSIIPLNKDSSGFVILDVNKKPLAILGSNYKLNSLFLNYKDSLFKEPKLTISPALTAWYTNQDAYDPFSTVTTTDVIANGILTPILALPSLNFISFFNYLMKIGVLSSDDPILTKSKKEKALREIKTMHGIED